MTNQEILEKAKEMDKKHKKTIALDVDGVLAHYDTWKGSDHFGEPRPGAVEFTKKLSETYSVMIFTTRTKVDMFGREEGDTVDKLTLRVKEWLDQHGFSYDSIYAGQGKPFFAALVDDRAINIVKNPTELDFQIALHDIRFLVERE